MLLASNIHIYKIETLFSTHSPTSYHIYQGWKCARTLCLADHIMHISVGAENKDKILFHAFQTRFQMKLEYQIFMD